MEKDNNIITDNDIKQKIMEEFYNKCKWFDVKLKSLGYDGVVVNTKLNEIPIYTYIFTKDISRWFEYRREDDNTIKSLNTISTKFYEFEKIILKSN